MDLGIVGLGRMGGNIARRLLRRGHRCVVYNRSPGPAEALAKAGAVAAPDLAGLVAALPAPRHVWVMLPAGDATDEAIAALAPLLSPGDLVVDGGNSYWKDDLRRAAGLAALGIGYVDAGVSGGVWGLERGFALMVGGDPAHVARLDRVLTDLAPDPAPIAEGNAPMATRPYVHAGATGAGHFAKMVHNGIEYGMMQALAEGLDILRGAASERLPPADRLAIDVPGVTQAWRRGSVVQSWLLDLAAEALARDPDLSAYAGRVADSGEGRWTVEAAMAQDVPAPVITAAVFARFRSRVAHTFGEQALSAMRDGFGGHKEPPA